MGTVGPTVPRWRLGEELRRHREAADLTKDDAAKKLDCTPWKIVKIERGSVGTKRAELDSLAELYGIASNEHDHLEELRQLGSQRGWWSKHGTFLGKQSVTFLEIESAATAITSWQPTVVHGLLQTEAYVRALMHCWRLPDEDVDRFVQIRLDRAKRMWDAGAQLWCVLDEAVLHRTLGDGEMLHEQLAALLDPPNGATIQVMPADAGPHPGVGGGLTMWDFEVDMHSPIAYSETPLGSLYEESDVLAARQVLHAVKASAASPADSKAIIRATMDRLAHLP